MIDSPFISTVTENNFEQDVIQNSMTKPVLVDFWADWCNPCKLLMPVLSKLAIEYNGAFHLAKINTEQEKKLSDDYGIRSLPTVKLFKQGEVVDEFNGAISESKIRDFISKHTFKESDIILQTAEEDYLTGNIESATTKVNKVLADEKHNKKAIVLSIKISLSENNVEHAEAILKSLPINMSDDPDIHELNHLIALTKDVHNAPGLQELESTLNQTDNIEAHYQLACRYALNEKYEEALKLFLNSRER